MVDDFDIENLTSFFAFGLFWLPCEIFMRDQMVAQKISSQN